MVEVELKFQIPAARRTALLKALDPKKSQQIQLQAKYYDTADRQLAKLPVKAILNALNIIMIWGN